jgi:hypothetical protein
MARKLTTVTVNTRLKPKGISLIGEYKGSLHKSVFKCVCGHEWVTTPSSVIHTTGCPKCSDRGQPKLTSEDVNTRLKPKGIVLIGEYKGSLHKSVFKCVCGHEWVTTPSSVIHISGCPKCSDKSRQKLKTNDINARLKPKGISLIGEYKGSLHKSVFKCVCGHKWSTLPNNVMHISGCPKCSTHGFNPSKAAKLYFLMIESPLFKTPIYKVGITNNEVTCRIKGMFAIEGTAFTILHVDHYDKGQDAYDMEQFIHNTFSYLSFKGGREIMQNGYTELYSKNILTLLKQS